MNLRPFLVALVAATCSLGGVSAARGRAPAPSPSPSASVALPAGLAQRLGFPGLSAGQPQSYATFVHDTERQSGLVNIIKKDDEVYLDLGPGQLDHPYIVAPVLASGVGADAFAGRVFSPFVMSFKRVGRRVLWVEENTDYSAPPDSSAANALAISVSDSVINSTPIVAEDAANGRVVVSAGFFLGDFENVGKSLAGPDAGPLALFGLARAPAVCGRPHEVVHRSYEGAPGKRRDSSEPRVLGSAGRYRRSAGWPRRAPRDALLDRGAAGVEQLHAAHRRRSRGLLYHGSPPVR